MEMLDKLERRLGWMSFPGVLRYYALFHVLVFVLQFMNPQIAEVLDFNKAKIFSGEVWRVFTFVFVSNRFGNPGAFAMLFLFFMVMIAFMMSDALEGAWGVFRATLFYYVGYLGLLLANFIYPAPLPQSGFFIYISAFFAFATLFPKHEFLMFFFFPVQVRWLGILLGVLLVLGVLGSPLYLGYLALGFSNYLLWAGIPAIRGGVKNAESASRRKKFESKKQGEQEAFHVCVVCGATEITHPEREFRIAADGKEYCDLHLPE